MSNSEKKSGIDWPTKGIEDWLADRGIAKMAAAILESSGSLASIFAQFIYVGEPLARGWWPDDRTSALAESFEDDIQRAAFVSRLRHRSK